MNHAVIVDAVRSPIGRAHDQTGMFRDVRADDLSAHLIRSLVERSGIDPHLIEDVKWGCVMQQGEQGLDVAKNAALIADLPVEVGGVTINRNCGSSLSAIHYAAMSIAAGCEDIQIAGGVEHMSHIKMTSGYDPSPALFYKHCEGIMHMGLTAENLARKHDIGREQQDAFAARSHQLAAEATEAGQFSDEVIPTWGRDSEGRKTLVSVDECVRADCTPETLAHLSPVFRKDPGSTVTAGNSSPINVGAAATLIMSEQKAKELGLQPLARIRAMAVVGVDPSEMGIGPVPAVHKVLKRAGLDLNQIDSIELNEAFAAQSLAVMKLLELGEEKVNTRGGAIAIGHPLGASGARIATTLLYRMRDMGARYGLATMCIGQGQGIATIFESCEN
jgi:acetyl-CoA acyltransferase